MPSDDKIKNSAAEEPTAEADTLEPGVSSQESLLTPTNPKVEMNFVSSCFLFHPFGCGWWIVELFHHFFVGRGKNWFFLTELVTWTQTIKAAIKS